MTRNRWTKSARSANTGWDCLEARHNDDDTVSVRDSKDRSGPQLHLSTEVWMAFVEFAKNN